MKTPMKTGEVTSRPGPRGSSGSNDPKRSCLMDFTESREQLISTFPHLWSVCWNESETIWNKRSWFKNAATTNTLQHQHQSFLKTCLRAAAWSTPSRRRRPSCSTHTEIILPPFYCLLLNCSCVCSSAAVERSITPPDPAPGLQPNTDMHYISWAVRLRGPRCSKENTVKEPVTELWSSEEASTCSLL